MNDKEAKASYKNSNVHYLIYVDPVCITRQCRLAKKTLNLCGRLTKFILMAVYGSRKIRDELWVRGYDGHRLLRRSTGGSNSQVRLSRNI